MQKQKLPTVETYHPMVAGVGLRLLGALHDTYIKLELNCLSADFGGIYKIHSYIIHMTEFPKTGDACRTKIMATKLVFSSADILFRCSAHSHRAVSPCVTWPLAFRTFSGCSRTSDCLCFNCSGSILL